MTTTPTIRHRFTHPADTADLLAAEVYDGNLSAEVSVGGHVVTVRAIDGEVACGVEVFDVDARGVLYGEYRLAGGPSTTRPVVIGVIAVLLGTLAR